MRNILSDANAFEPWREGRWERCVDVDVEQFPAVIMDVPRSSPRNVSPAISAVRRSFRKENGKMGLERDLPKLNLATGDSVPDGPASGVTSIDGPSEGDEEVLVFKLSKLQNEGLGFSIVDGVAVPGVFVAYIFEDTLAASSGLHINDQIFEINGEDVQNADRATAAALLKSAPTGMVTLKIARSPRFNSCEPLLSFLAKHSGITTGSAGMYESLYGENVGMLGTKRNAPDSARVNGTAPNFVAVDLQERSRIPKQKIINGEADAEAHRSQKSAGNRDSGDKHPTRLAHKPFIVIFVVMVICGLTVLILESITAGIFHAIIGGEEYAGIYVGFFAAVVGIVGLYTAFTKVRQSHELRLHLSNMILQGISLAQAICLFAATAALIARHVGEQSRFETVSAGNNSTVVVSTDRSSEHYSSLLGLKATNLILYFFLILAGITFFILVFTLSRRRTTSYSVRKV